MSEKGQGESGTPVGAAAGGAAGAAAGAAGGASATGALAGAAAGAAAGEAGGAGGGGQQADQSGPLKYGEGLQNFGPETNVSDQTADVDAGADKPKGIQPMGMPLEEWIKTPEGHKYWFQEGKPQGDFPDWYKDDYKLDTGKDEKPPEKK